MSKHLERPLPKVYLLDPQRVGHRVQESSKALKAAGRGLIEHIEQKMIAEVEEHIANTFGILVDEEIVVTWEARIDVTSIPKPSEMSEEAWKRVTEEYGESLRKHFQEQSTPVAVTADE